jgi:AGZA family xanthine/uracil permease-like MFS transporter
MQERDMGAIARYFDFAGNKTSLGRETVAGLTTFVTMAYIIIVNPKILEAAGIPFGPSMVATILSACFGTLFMGLYAKKPIAIAPYMGENAFIAYTVCGLLGVRKWLATSIPKSLKMGFVMGIGLFLTFIGLMNTGIVVKPAVGPVPVSLGAVSDPAVLLAVGGFVLMAVLMAWKVPGAILIGIAAVTAVAWGMGVAPLPGDVLAAPPSLEPTLLAMDVGGALTWGFFSVILTVLVMDFVDTMGTLYAVGHQAGLLDENGDMPDIEKPMLADALATIVAAVLGTTSAGAYIESATGIESGGRTGFTSVVTGLLFLLALFLSPLFIAIPVCAYGPSLIIVGMLMMSSVSRLDFGHVSETLPCFLTVILMSFSYNLGIGMTAGFLAYPIMKVLTGRTREVNAGMWFLAALSLVFYVFYPH